MSRLVIFQVGSYIQGLIFTLYLKLNSIQSNSGMSKSSTPQMSPEEEAQREDEQILSKNMQDIEEIMQLLDAGVDRTEAEKRLAEARGAVEQHKVGKVFHDHKGAKIPVHHHASNLKRLVDALELSWKTKRHGADLHKALHSHLRHRVKVLERVLLRGHDFA